MPASSTVASANTAMCFPFGRTANCQMKYSGSPLVYARAGPPAPPRQLATARAISPGAVGSRTLTTHGILPEQCAISCNQFTY